MPWSDDGADRLAAELERAHEVVEPPQPVWLFDRDLLSEQRADVYGWRLSTTRQALLVWRQDGADRVEWVCEPYVRPRRGE